MPASAPGWARRTRSALAWLAGAGLGDLELRAFPVIHRQPLPGAVRRYITGAIFGGHFADAVVEGRRTVGMTDADEDLWRRLSDPAGPDDLLDQPDYYCALTPLLALGRMPG